MHHREVGNKTKSVTDEMETTRHEASELHTGTRQLANRWAPLTGGGSPADAVYRYKVVMVAGGGSPVMVTLMWSGIIVPVCFRCEMIEESREGQMHKNERYLRAKEEELQKREQ